MLETSKWGSRLWNFFDIWRKNHRENLRPGYSKQKTNSKGYPMIKVYSNELEMLYQMG